MFKTKSKLNQVKNRLTVIEPKSGWRLLNIKELIEYQGSFHISCLERYKSLIRSNYFRLFLGSAATFDSNTHIYDHIWKSGEIVYRGNSLYSFFQCGHYSVDIFDPVNGYVESKLGGRTTYVR